MPHLFSVRVFCFFNLWNRSEPHRNGTKRSEVKRSDRSDWICIYSKRARETCYQRYSFRIFDDINDFIEKMTTERCVVNETDPILCDAFNFATTFVIQISRKNFEKSLRLELYEIVCLSLVALFFCKRGKKTEISKFYTCKERSW